jgi:hypothetical protein
MARLPDQHFSNGSSPICHWHETDALLDRLDQLKSYTEASTAFKSTASPERSE